jgi:GAF domain-containing protein
VLRWELRESVSRATLHRVPNEPSSGSAPPTSAGSHSGAGNRKSPVDDRDDLVRELVEDLAGAKTTDDVSRLFAQYLRRHVPGALDVAVTLSGRRGQTRSVLTGENLLSVPLRDALVRLTAVPGPVASTMRDRSTHVVTDTTIDARWQAFSAQAAAAGIRSILSVPVGLARAPLGAVTLFSSHPDAFDRTVGSLVEQLALHAAATLERVHVLENLLRADESRELIGQAVGILMERRRISAEDGFDQLVKLSQRTNVKLHVLAETVVVTGQDPESIRGR